MHIFLNENILISGGEWVPEDDVAFSTNIQELWKCLNCFNFYIEPIVYYSGAGLIRLFQNLEDISSITEYALTNPIQRLRVLLDEINAVNWSLSPFQRADYHYYYLSGGGAIPYYVNGTSVAEATEYKFSGEEVALLNLASSEYNEANPIHINRSSINPPPNMVICPLVILVSDVGVIAYVRQHRQPRTFNWNPKHGENGKGMIPNKGEVVSPLEGSRQEAELLLPKAVNSRKTTELYAYDEAQGKYIVFKDENTPDNKFHPYHPINQEEVPEDVKKFLRP